MFFVSDREVVMHIRAGTNTYLRPIQPPLILDSADRHAEPRVCCYCFRPPFSFNGVGP